MPISSILLALLQLTLTAQPYPNSQFITGLEWAPTNTIIRLAPGADNWLLTWADDGRLYGGGGDTFGAFQKNKKKFSLVVSRIEGHPPDIRGFDVNNLTVGQGRKGRKASGMLCVGGRLYMWVRNADEDGHGSQLAWSDDHGARWRWADWTWEPFGLCTFVNYGQDYTGARDDFVYTVSHDHPDAYVGADRYILMRVLKDRILDKDAYQFFQRRQPDGSARWTRDVEQRGAIFECARMCRRSGMSYNAALKRYLWWQQWPENGGDTRSAGGFGVYDAPEPWGPWTTVYFTKNWDVGPGESGNFPTKWMSADGRTVHLVFSGDDHFSVRQAELRLTANSQKPDGNSP